MPELGGYLSKPVRAAQLSEILGQYLSGRRLAAC